MKHYLMLFFALLILAGCSTQNAMEVFAIDARTKDVALEDLVLVSNEKEIYIQPTYHLFSIEKLNPAESPHVSAPSFTIYNKEKEQIYSATIGSNQEGVLDTRTSQLDGDLVGAVSEVRSIEDGETLYVHFSYEKEQTNVEEEIEVKLVKR